MQCIASWPLFSPVSDVALGALAVETFALSNLFRAPRPSRQGPAPGRAPADLFPPALRYRVAALTRSA